MNARPNETLAYASVTTTLNVSSLRATLSLSEREREFSHTSMKTASYNDADAYDIESIGIN
jgi:hypothetical protein